MSSSDDDRGGVIAILEPVLGIVPAVAASALPYAVYHVGYGMTGSPSFHAAPSAVAGMSSPR
jgi:hypothetical protein